MEKKEESLDELLQRHEILTEVLSTKDQELSEASQRLDLLRARYNSQQSELADYKQIVKRLQDRILTLTEKGVPRKSTSEVKAPPVASPVIRGKQGKVEGVVRQDENGLVEICFDPGANGIEIKPDTEVCIVSEFTGWNPDKMSLETKNNKVVYVGKYQLVPGYKHKFRFLVNGNLMSDATLPQMTNPAGHSYNYVIVQRAGEGSPLAFEKHIKEEERKVHLEKYFATESHEAKEQPMTDDLTGYQGRLFHKFMFPEGIYRLIKWDRERYEGTLIRLCDNYKVPLDQHDLKGETLSLPEIQGQFYAMSEPEEKMFERMFYSNKIHIKYKVGVDMYVLGSSSYTYCEPVAVEPADIPIQEYTINYDQNNKKISSIINRNFGPVLFTQERIDEESGLQHGSVLEIYSTIVEEGVYNLLHMHIDDTSPSVTIDVVTLAEGETASDHKVFGKDATGRPLRYKILIKDGQVYTVLYNTGSKVEVVNYTETQFEPNEVVYIEESQTFGRIKSLPISLLSAGDKGKLENYKREEATFAQTAVCQKRCFEDLPGYVDIEITSEGAGNGFYVAMPICLLKKLTTEQKKKMETMEEEKKTKLEEKAKELIQRMKTIIDEYEGNKAEIPLQKKQALMSELSKYESELTGLFSDTEIGGDLQSEFKEQCTRSYAVTKEIISEIRIQKLSGKI